MSAAADTLAALALVPEQLPDYVRKVSASTLRFAGEFAAYLHGDTAVLVAMPTADAPKRELSPAVERAIAAIRGWQGVRALSVLGTARPSCAPAGAPGYTEVHDSYLAVDLLHGEPQEPCSGVPGQKLRNTLRRAEAGLHIAVEPWNEECQALAKAYALSRPLLPGTRHIFEHLAPYAATPGVRVFTARHRETGELHALCLGDFNAFATAFYMFAFRKPHAIPGAADLLLHALLREAHTQGHERVNLGLAVNPGIAFFKRKWHARDFLPLVECSWVL